MSEIIQSSKVRDLSGNRVPTDIPEPGGMDGHGRYCCAAFEDGRGRWPTTRIGVFSAYHSDGLLFLRIEQIGSPAIEVSLGESAIPLSDVIKRERMRAIAAFWGAERRQAARDDESREQQYAAEARAEAAEQESDDDE